VIIRAERSRIAAVGPAHAVATAANTRSPRSVTDVSDTAVAIRSAEATVVTDTGKVITTIRPADAISRIADVRIADVSTPAVAIGDTSNTYMIRAVRSDAWALQIIGTVVTGTAVANLIGRAIVIR
jgi:hypothetical protein